MSGWKKVLFVARIIQAIGSVAREAQSVHYTVKGYKADREREAYSERRYGKKLPTNGQQPFHKRGPNQPSRPTNVHANPPQRYWNDESPD